MNNIVNAEQITIETLLNWILWVLIIKIYVYNALLLLIVHALQHKNYPITNLREHPDLVLQLHVFNAIQMLILLRINFGVKNALILAKFIHKEIAFVLLLIL
jgi:hypothetical protein